MTNFVLPVDMILLGGAMKMQAGMNQYTLVSKQIFVSIIRESEEPITLFTCYSEYI